MPDRAKSRLNPTARSTPITPRSSSRLHKSGNFPSRSIPTGQKKALIVQTVIFVSAPILMGIMFAIFVIPFLIKVTGYAKMSQTTSQSSALVPQSPILNAPPTHIATTQLTISGFAEPNHTVIILVNDKEISSDHSLVVPSSGEFSTELNLSTEGEYTISAYSIDPESKQNSPSSPKFSVTVDLTTPTISFSDLTNRQEIVGRDNQTLTISGTTKPQAKIYLNDRLSRADAEGKFNLRLELTEGDNVLNFVVEDEAGNKMTEQLTVRFTP
ncbi:hypothetical protein FWH30_02360 [Microgenomates group bacterium]|nr:hypothetical protein [Microgenomates group bacterium]